MSSIVTGSGGTRLVKLEGTTLVDRGRTRQGEEWPQGWVRVQEGVRVKVAVRKEEGLPQEVSQKQEEIRTRGP